VQRDAERPLEVYFRLASLSNDFWVLACWKRCLEHCIAGVPGKGRSDLVTGVWVFDSA